MTNKLDFIFGISLDKHIIVKYIISGIPDIFTFVYFIDPTRDDRKAKLKEIENILSEYPKKPHQ